MVYEDEFLGSFTNEEEEMPKEDEDVPEEKTETEGEDEELDDGFEEE